MLDMFMNVRCINNNKLTLVKTSRGLKSSEARGLDTDLWTHLTLNLTLVVALFEVLGVSAICVNMFFKRAGHLTR